jgi:hypothetical protein
MIFYHHRRRRRHIITDEAAALWAAVIMVVVEETAIIIQQQQPHRPLWHPSSCHVGTFFVVVSRAGNTFPRAGEVFGVIRNLLW